MTVKEEIVSAWNDFPKFAQKNFKIRPKEGGLVPFIFNDAQHFLHKKAEEMKAEKGYVRIIFLKARQLGGSSYIAARMLRNTMYKKGVKTAIMLHDRDSTNAMFDMTKRYYNNTSTLIKPKLDRSNDKTMRFGSMDSEYVIATAGAKSAGHGQTIHNGFFSEVARWPNASEHASGILQTVPLKKGTEVWIESTANGPADWFYDSWQQAVAGESDFIPLFYGWLDHKEYSVHGEWDEFADEEEEILHNNFDATFEQLLWRRKKIAELGGGIAGKYLFYVQYPTTPDEAFRASTESYFNPLSVKSALTTKPFDSIGATVIGIDAAYQGKDSTAIAVRQGRNIVEIVKMQRADAATVTGKLIQLHRRYSAKRIFIDIAYGVSIYDMGREAGLPIEPVNFASSPIYTNEVVNRRAEMYKHFNEWLNDQPCSICSEPGLEEELLSIGFLYNAKGKLLMQPKDEIRKKLGRSPDMVDACVLTTASPVFSDVSESLGGFTTGSVEINDY